MTTRREVSAASMTTASREGSRAASGRVVVAGGSGLIGRPLVADLTTAGYEVVVLSRSPGEVRGLPAGARAVGWDGRTAKGWAREVDGARAVVNLAGASLADGRWTDRKKRAIKESRLASTGAVVEALAEAEARPEVLLQGSAVGYYGPRGDELLTEEAEAGDDFLAEVTVAWEAASAPADELGVRRVLLRTGVVLSRDGGALPKMALPFRLFVGGPAGRGDQWVPWIHMDDEVRAIRFLLEHTEVIGPINLTAPQPVTNEELSRRLAEVLGRPSALRAPDFALRLALGEMADVLLTGQNAIPARLRSLGFAFRYPRLAEALAELYR